MSHHIRGIILEGYSNAGKTSVLKALKKLQAQDETSEHTLIVLSEHYSQVLNNVHGEFKRLNRDEHLKLLRERVGMLRQLNEWANYMGPAASRRTRGLFFILERFHLNHRVAFPDTSTHEIESIENDLLSLGEKCALLTVSSENVKQRMQSRTPHEWINKPTEEIDLAANEFIQTQSKLRDQASKSSVPTIEINTDKRDWTVYANQIMESLS